jgi:Na+/proline symporter
MNYFSIDFLIVYAFLTITLIIGIRAGRGIKDIEGYALGNKNYGTLTLILTFLATNIGGSSLIDGSAGVFSSGIIRIVPELAVMLQALVFAFFITPKVLKFNNCLTIGDVMETSYGKLSKIIAGVLGLFYSIAMVAMQLVGLAIVMEVLLGVKSFLTIIIGGAFLSFYASYGGIKSVTATDVFQFLVLIIVIPLLANTVLKYAGGIKEVFLHLPSSKLEIFGHANFSYYLTLFLIWGIFPTGITSPPIFQRLLMANNSKQLRNQYLIISVFHPVLQLVIMLIGLAGFILYPTIKANDLVPHIIQELLPIGGKGLAIAGIIALVMSTADSYLHAAGLVFTNDILKPICNMRGWKVNELKWAKQSTIVIGIVTSIIALQSTSMLGLSLLAFKFTGPLLMFPLIATIRGFRIDKKTFYSATAITLIAFLLTDWLLSASYKHLALPISITINGIVLFSMYYVKHKKLNTVDDYTTRTYWKPKKKTLLPSIKQMIPTPQRIINYSKQQVIKYGAPYMLFGAFFVINYVFPFFMWTHDSPQVYDTIFLLRLIGGVMCALLIVQEKWPKSLLPYMPTFWHITVLYCLPFTSAMMFLLTQGSTEWLINIAIIIIMLFILVDWITALVLSVLGVSLATISYKLFIGPVHFSLDFSSKYLLLYQSIFGLLIGLIFARRKEQRFDKLTTDKETLALVNEENKQALLDFFKEKIRLLKTLKQAKVEDLTKAVSLIKELEAEQKQGFKEKKVVEATIEQLKKTLMPMAIGLERIESRATDYLRLQITTVDIDTLLASVQNYFSNFQIKNLSTYREITCDIKRIETMLLNSIEALKDFLEEGGGIYMTLEDTYLTYSLSTVKKDKSYIKKVPAIAFSLSTTASAAETKPSYQAQMQREALPLPTNPISLLLVTNKRIVKAHYGYSNIDISKFKDYTMHRYVLPIRVSDVRPRDMDNPYMELGMELLKADDTYPGALEQEKAFLSLVQQKTSVNLSDVEMAIEMIKWYHGPVKRKSGEPFYLHPLAVAEIVLNYNTDEATILGALLHDIVEDTSMLLENIELMFGQEVASIVDGVTHFESQKDSFYKVQLSSEENILMLLETEEKRVLYVKIADRMHNMRTIKGHSSYAKQRQIAEETLHFFVPLAQKLSLEEAAEELKERSMAVIMEAK